MATNPDRVTGWWIFAGTLLGIGGVLNLIWGIAAISNSKYFTDDVVYIISTVNTWGWIVLIIGVIELIAAFSLFSGGGFGRWIGIIAAALNAIAALLTIPSAPFWAIAIFFLSIVILYELAKPGTTPPPNRGTPFVEKALTGLARCDRITLPRQPRRRFSTKRKAISVPDIETLGPIDYIVIEWPGRQPDGSALPHLIDLVDRGIVRILDLVFIAKDEDGSVAALELSELGTRSPCSTARAPACSATTTSTRPASVLEPGTSAAVLVWENRWAAPFAVALRKNGAQLVASGRIPMQALVAAVEASRVRPTNRPTSTRSTTMPGLHSRRRPHRRHRRYRDARQQQRLAPPGQQVGAAGAAAAAAAAVPPPAPVAAAPAVDPIEQLKELGQLHEKGILTDEEFAVQKNKILSA